MGENKTPTAKAIEKLQKELETANKKNDQFSVTVLSHLIERVNESEALAEDIIQEHKNWDKCATYIVSQAKKQQVGGRAAVKDNVVYEWAEDYYHKDDKAQAEKEAREKKEKADRIANAKASALKKPETKATVSDTKSSKSVEKCTENEKNAKNPAENVQKPEKVSTEKPKKNDSMDGQLDLFSLFGM